MPVKIYFKDSFPAAHLEKNQQQIDYSQDQNQGNPVYSHDILLD